MCFGSSTYIHTYIHLCKQVCGNSRSEFVCVYKSTLSLIHVSNACATDAVAFAFALSHILSKSNSHQLDSRGALQD